MRTLDLRLIKRLITRHIKFDSWCDENGKVHYTANGDEIPRDEFYEYQLLVEDLQKYGN